MKIFFKRASIGILSIAAASLFGLTGAKAMTPESQKELKLSKQEKTDAQLIEEATSNKDVALKLFGDMIEKAKEQGLVHVQNGYSKNKEVWESSLNEIRRCAGQALEILKEIKNITPLERLNFIQQVNDLDRHEGQLGFLNRENKININKSLLNIQDEFKNEEEIKSYFNSKFFKSQCDRILQNSYFTSHNPSTTRKTPSDFIKNIPISLGFFNELKSKMDDKLEVYDNGIIVGNLRYRMKFKSYENESHEYFKESSLLESEKIIEKFEDYIQTYSKAKNGDISKNVKSKKSITIAELEELMKKGYARIVLPLTTKVSLIGKKYQPYRGNRFCDDFVYGTYYNYRRDISIRHIEIQIFKDKNEMDKAIKAEAESEIAPSNEYQQALDKLGPHAL